VIGRTRAADIGVGLETSNPRNVAFYTTLGFAQSGELDLTDDVRLIRMTRE
jgi:hypothetical protein